MPTTSPSPLRLAVLGSGSGSNYQAIQDAIDEETLRARVVCVLSDVPDAGILERAARHKVPGQFLGAAPFKTKLDGLAEERYLDALAQAGAECIVLAGFMRILKPRFLRQFPGRVLNIHPALLPAFPGLASWRQALDYGVKIAGCTVHIVDEGTDTGPILLQRAVPVLEDDTPESLHARIQAAEHEAYPQALRWIAAGRVRMEGRRVRILPDGPLGKQRPPFSCTSQVGRSSPSEPHSTGMVSGPGVKPPEEKAASGRRSPNGRGTAPWAARSESFVPPFLSDGTDRSDGSDRSDRSLQ